MLPSFKKVPLDLRELAVGTLGVIEFNTIGFMPERIYWISNVPTGITRGHHAHKELRQLIWAVSGSVSVDLYAGETISHYELDRNSPALSLQPGLWRVLKNFTPDATVLVLCDRQFEESDYIRDYDEYLAWHKEAYA
jgi:hypothetical protein